MANAVETRLTRELAQAQVELKKQQWLAAARWEKRVNESLGPAGITFRQWLILDEIGSRVERTGDGVRENQLARTLELDGLTLWHAMAVLDHRGFVSRGCSMTGKARPVFVTYKGAEMLRGLQSRLEGASALYS